MDVACTSNENGRVRNESLSFGGRKAWGNQGSTFFPDVNAAAATPGWSERSLESSQSTRATRTEVLGKKRARERRRERGKFGWQLTFIMVRQVLGRRERERELANGADWHGSLACSLRLFALANSGQTPPPSPRAPAACESLSCSQYLTPALPALSFAFFSRSHAALLMRLQGNTFPRRGKLIMSY